MGATEQLFLLPGAARRDAAVERWFADRPGELGDAARRCFDVMRSCGDDVREILHDGHPTACVGEAAGLLQGTGKLMRHVKVSPGHPANADALAELILAAYLDMKRRVEVDQPSSEM